MKKVIFLLAIFLVQALHAMPYRCETLDNEGGTPLIKFKINPKRPVVNKKGQTWNYFVLGVTPNVGFRKVVYGAGAVTKEKGYLTFVDDGFVTGSLKFEKESDEFVGEVSIDGIHQGRNFDMRCIDVSLTES